MSEEQILCRNSCKQRGLNAYGPGIRAGSLEFRYRENGSTLKYGDLKNLHFKIQKIRSKIYCGFKVVVVYMKTKLKLL